MSQDKDEVSQRQVLEQLRGDGPYASRRSPTTWNARLPAGDFDYDVAVERRLAMRAVRRERLHTDRSSTLASVHAFVQVTVSVNGEEYTREVEPRLLLVHFLRDELG